ncbi:hypothetical protein [Sphingobacterium sp. SGR-19]|uniref:hypothetical protein n=1 Tax=Sphingobacterium sp. SGR-19 TaxID=2710886 RepID=UPI0013EDFF55|nr:hypothetical protein [Sphingobacterium sp. SGR-19]NGM65934.1 hypothetical protein [Sphingobacterium sp. SGR-19]
MQKKSSLQMFEIVDSTKDGYLHISNICDATMDVKEGMVQWRNHMRSKLFRAIVG